MSILLLSILAFALVLIPIDTFGEVYWENLEIDIEKSDRISGPSFDVIVIKAEFTNNNDEEITIYNTYVRLDDNKKREFSHSNYFDLQANISNYIEFIFTNL